MGTMPGEQQKSGKIRALKGPTIRANSRIIRLAVCSLLGLEVTVSGC